METCGVYFALNKPLPTIFCHQSAVINQWFKTDLFDCLKEKPVYILIFYNIGFVSSRTTEETLLNNFQNLYYIRGTYLTDHQR